MTVNCSLLGGLPGSHRGRSIMGGAEEDLAERLRSGVDMGRGSVAAHAGGAETGLAGEADEVTGCSLSWAPAPFVSKLSHSHAVFTLCPI